MFDRMIDGGGFTLVFAGMGVVFFALAILLYMMKAMRSGFEWLHHRRQIRAAVAAGGDASMYTKPEDVPELVVAAIALTMLLDEEEAHDEESLVLTLRAMAKPYNNWWMSSLQRPWLTGKGHSRAIPTHPEMN